ncbi:MAG: hypothetical protein IIB46_04150 [Nitrospinae bacterium]|nr:hypothetical protein [Nitrospinota bacterium]
MEWELHKDQLRQKLIDLTKVSAGFKTYLSAVYSLYRLLTGATDAYVNMHPRSCVWDFAAGCLCLQESVPETDRNNIGFFPDGTLLEFNQGVSMQAILSPYPELVREIITVLNQ